MTFKKDVSKKDDSEFITSRNYKGEGLGNEFYLTKRWRRTRAIVMQQYHYICQRCEGAAVIVHHIEPLTELNKHDEQIAYGTDNLIPLCIECHNAIHYGTNKQEVKRNEIEFDSNGNVIQTQPTEIFI